MTSISFTVIGKPQPKGAHTSFVPRRRDGSLVMRAPGVPVVVTKDTNDRQEAAQQELSIAALSARNRQQLGVWDGPVVVTLAYFFDRPKGHFGTGRNAGILKDSAPRYPLTAADIDKLERLVFDALTGTILRDDKQVVDCLHRKRYTEDDEPARIEVMVEYIEDQVVGTVVPDEQLALAA